MARHYSEMTALDKASTIADAFVEDHRRGEDHVDQIAYDWARDPDAREIVQILNRVRDVGEPNMGIVADAIAEEFLRIERGIHSPLESFVPLPMAAVPKPLYSRCSSIGG